MIKLQQYYVFKVNTSFLKKNKYNATLSIDDARRSGLMVSLGDSQMLRSLRELKNEVVDVNFVSELILEQKRIKKKKSNDKNAKRLKQIFEILDDMLFVEDVVSVFVDDVRHYEYIGKNGFYLNGKKYKRFICGAGQARRNNAIFINEEYFISLYNILNNNRNPDIKITPAKFSAYFGLASSSSLQVRTPRFCVVPDYTIVRKEKVDFIEEVVDGDDNVYEDVKDIEFTPWDGQGIISPEFAEKWSQDLGLDYTPSSFIIRANFIKGMVCVIDFHEYSKRIKNNYIKDVYGNIINITNVDIILTQSQFKLWDSYSSFEEYLAGCKSNNLNWGITRVSPKNENKYTFLNYQFIQVLNLNDEKIKNISKKTLEFFSNIINGKVEDILIYLLGKNTRIYDPSVINKIQDVVTRAIIINNSTIKDPYVKNHIIKTMNKKIKESYIGNLLVDGQYTMMISDPYAFMEYIFGGEIKGLLERNQHYSKYWIDQKINKIAAMRAPLVWNSEVNILNLKSNKDIDFWYKHLDCSVIYNIHGNDVLLHGGSDFDGDIVCLTNCEEVINSAQTGNPIYYEPKKVPKEIIDVNNLYVSDIKGFNQKIGFITNCGTSAFSLLPMFEKESLEYQETVKRLKLFRKEQGNNIDATKGLVIKPFPAHWTKWEKPNLDLTEKDRAEKEFQNRIVINKRPLFMRWLYSKYNTKYIDFVNRFDTRAKIRFNKTLKQILSSKDNNLAKEELSLKHSYYKYNPFIESDCIMNNVSNYMEETIRQSKFESNKDNEYDHNILRSKNVSTTKSNVKKIYDLYLEYKKEKRNFSSIVDQDGSQIYKTIEQYNKNVRQRAYKIVSNSQELANIVVDICYVVHPNDSKSFAWNVFGEEIILNIIENSTTKYYAPFEDCSGSIKFLGETYSMMEIFINDKNI